MTDPSPEYPIKTCRACKQAKPITSFYADPKSADGRAWCCSQCTKERVKKWQKENPEKFKERQKQNRKNNPVVYRESSARYRKSHVDRVATTQRVHRDKYPERIKETKVRSAEKHREETQRRQADLYAANRKIVIARVVQWQKDNPHLVAARQKRRRARKNGAPVNDLTHQDWIAIQEAYEHKCAYCLRRFKGKLTQEHITPLSKGGSHTLSNIVPACRNCNSKKACGPVLRPIQPLLLVFKD